MQNLRLITTSQIPILRQLRLEEALLRASTGNWCIINDGSAVPAIVMGISGKPQELIHIDKARSSQIQVLKRFSGGGTVVVDQDTQFVTLVIESSALPDVECYPRPVMRWTERFYSPLLSLYGEFHLQEHDYVFGQSKFGGNAQAITRQRWLHHTSFLWDFQMQHMRLLQHPMRAPVYRAGRDHLDFVTCLKHFLPTRTTLPSYVEQALKAVGFAVEACSFEQAEELLQLNYLKTTKEVQL